MKTIFVVEEDDSSRNLLWELLTQRKDHTVHIVKDAETALRALEDLEYGVDLLIAGLELEIENGVPFLAYCRDKYSSTDIIAFTRKVDSDLTHFPVLLYLSSSSGQGDDDITAIFDTLGSNSKKIAVTKDDGETHLHQDSG